MASLLERLRDPSEKTLGVLLLAPAFLLLALIVIYPIGKLIFNSFFDLRLSGGGGLHGAVHGGGRIRAAGKPGRVPEQAAADIAFLCQDRRQRGAYQRSVDRL